MDKSNIQACRFLESRLRKCETNLTFEWKNEDIMFSSTLTKKTQKLDDLIYALKSSEVIDIEKDYFVFPDANFLKKTSEGYDSTQILVMDIPVSELLFDFFEDFSNMPSFDDLCQSLPIVCVLDILWIN